MLNYVIINVRVPVATAQREALVYTTHRERLPFEQPNWAQLPFNHGYVTYIITLISFYSLS